MGFTDLVDQLQDMGVERQLVRAVPGMVRAPGDEGLREAFSGHLQARRSHPAEAMQSYEGPDRRRGEVIEQKEKSEKSPFDAALIAAAQRVEHYFSAHLR